MSENIENKLLLKDHEVSQEIIDKIKACPELKDFLERVNIKWFKTFAEFKREKFSIHENHKCPKHNLVVTSPNFGHECFYSEDTEFDTNHMLDDFFPKKYPCCINEERGLDEFGEEVVCNVCFSDDADYCEICAEYYCSHDDCNVDHKCVTYTH